MAAKEGTASEAEAEEEVSADTQVASPIHSVWDATMGLCCTHSGQRPWKSGNPLTDMPRGSVLGDSRPCQDSDH